MKHYRNSGWQPGISFQQKFDAARALAAQLDEWEIPFSGCYNAKYHYVFQVGRFHLWAYWRPMTIARYERLTLDYHGPYLPIFASRNQYVQDEQVVWEGYDFNMRRNHHYQRIPFYFVCPGFLLLRPWPPEREWRWHPAIRVTASIMREVLRLEDTYGGWRTNSRGRPMIPKVTGCSGKDETVKPGEGWASLGFESVPLSTQEQQELFDEEGQDCLGWASLQ